MIHGSLFSGLGGFDLAARWAGIETVWQIENDAFCQKVLAKHFPKARRYGDIKRIKSGGDLKPVDIISGGFPCQPFSCAGKRRGKEDDRFLWPEMLRIISEVRPAWVIAENVPGIIGMELDQVLIDLENADYKTQTFIIPACGVNAPHTRKRVWIIANLRSDRLGQGALSMPEQDSGKTFVSDAGCHACNAPGERCREAGRDIGRSEKRPSRTDFNDVANSEGNVIRAGLCEREPGRERRKRFGHSDKQDVTDTGHTSWASWRNVKSSQLAKGNEGSPTFIRRQIELLECYWQEPWPEVAARLCRVGDGVPNRVDRLRGLGNAIVPQVAFQFFTFIKQIEDTHA